MVWVSLGAMAMGGLGQACFSAPTPPPQTNPPGWDAGGTPVTFDAGSQPAAEAAGSTPEAEAAASTPEAAAAPPAGCQPHTGPGVMEPSEVTTDTTWTAADSPHFVLGPTFAVQSGATLTIEPCAEVRMADDAAFTVNGALIAEGTASQPIQFVAADPTKPWAYLRFMSGTGRLAYVTFDGGGKSDPSSLGTIEVRNPNEDTDRELVRVDHVTIRGSERYGLSLRSGGKLTADSTALTITGAQVGPIVTDPELAGSIPDGVYTGNGRDEIELSVLYVTADTTFHDRSVPYDLGHDTNISSSTLRVEAAPDGSAALLTIEPGVTIRFGQDGWFYIQKSSSSDPAGAALSAVGTMDKPIVFTSSLPAAAATAGVWAGLHFGGGVADPRDRLDYVQISYAGGTSGWGSYHCENLPTGGVGRVGNEDSAIAIFGTPSGQFITHTSITASAGIGIDRAWGGPAIDFLPTNDFQRIARCEQSYPPDQMVSAGNWECPSGPIDCVAAQ
jgi:hypothetical protein